MSRYRGLLAVVLVAQIALAAWALDLDDLVAGDDERPFTPAEIAPSDAPIDVERGQAIAVQHAQRWSVDARLVAVTMRLEWPDEAAPADQIALPVGGWLVYTYVDGSETLAIYLDRRTGIYITSVRSDYGDASLPAIDLTGYLRGSTTAALTAEVLHGATYRTACPANRRAALVTPSRVANADGSWTPIWVVTYADTRFTGDIDVLVQVDATNGNVIRSEAAERPC
jgi:hypothetical protein